jgi:hypothetical protein
LSLWSMLLTLDRFLWLLTIVSCHCQLYNYAYGTYYIMHKSDQGTHYT